MKVCRCPEQANMSKIKIHTKLLIIKIVFILLVVSSAGFLQKKFNLFKG